MDNILLYLFAVFAPLLIRVGAAESTEQRCIWVPASGERSRDAAGAIGVDILDIQQQNKNFEDPDLVLEGHTYTLPCRPSPSKPATWSVSATSTFFLRLNGFTVANEPTGTTAPFLPSSAAMLLPTVTNTLTPAAQTTPATSTSTSTRRFRWI